MEVILTILGLAIGTSFVALMIAAIILFQKHQQDKPVPYSWKHLGIIFLILICLDCAIVVINSNTQKDEAKTTATKQSASPEEPEPNLDSNASDQSSNPSENSESDAPDKDPYANLSASKRQELNQSLDDELIQDQQEANKGTQAYTWSLVVGGIVYDKQRGFIIEVNDQFNQLNKKTKTFVGNQAQSFIQAQLLMIGGEVQPDDPAPYVNFHYNGDRIGHSRMWDPGKFVFKSA